LPDNARAASAIAGNYWHNTIPWYIAGNQPEGVREQLGSKGQTESTAKATKRMPGAIYILGHVEILAITGEITRAMFSAVVLELGHQDLQAQVTLGTRRHTGMHRPL